MPPFNDSHGTCWPTPEARCLPWLSRRKPVFHLPRNYGLCRSEKSAKIARASKGSHCSAVTLLLSNANTSDPLQLISAAGPCMLPTITRRWSSAHLHPLTVQHVQHPIPLTTTSISRCTFPTVLPPPPPSFKGAGPSDRPGIQIRGDEPSFPDHREPQGR